MAEITPLRAIRAKCLDCCCGSENEVKLCALEKCPLYVYRDGHNPKKKGQGGKGNIDALLKYREAQTRKLSTEQF